MLASAWFSATATPMAAATLTLAPDCLVELEPLSSVLVDGVVAVAVLVLSVMSTPAVAEFSSAADCSWASFCSSGVVPAAGLLESLGSFLVSAPLALAEAVVVRAVPELASRPMAVAPETLRFRLAESWSMATVAAREAPTATSPTVWPVAVVVTVSVWSACRDRAPVRSMVVAEVPRLAVVVFRDTATAARGVMLTEAPAAPPVAVVVRVWVASAWTVTPPALVSAAPSVSSARVLSTTTFTARVAPTPTLELEPELAAATWAAPVAVLVSTSAACTSTSPLPAFTVVPRVWPWTSASWLLITTFRAREPATPTLLAPAPLVAEAPKVLAGAAVGMSEVRVSPWEVTLAPSPIRDWLVLVPTFKATAAPTPTRVSPLWLPSAVAEAAIWPALARVSLPPLVTVRLGSRAAEAVDTSTLTAMAAATVTAAPLLWALGAVCLLPLSWVLASLPAASPAVSAALLWAATWPSTDVPAPPLPSVALPLLSAGAPPAALAVALVLVPDIVVAFRVTSLPASRFRARVADTVSTAVVRANEAPTATLLPWVAPVAVVVMAVVWLASASYAPPMARAVPLSTLARVVSTARVTAAVGVMEILAPAAPPDTSVSRVWLAVAPRVRLPASVRTTFLSISAVVVFTAMFMPTEAPTPTSAELPLTVTFASALTVLLVVLLAVRLTSPGVVLLPASTLAAAWLVRLSAPARVAAAVFTTVFTAREPATPTLPPPAPLVASTS